VIMPFSDTESCTEQKWTEIFEYIIKPAVEESGLGYDCERYSPERENIIKGILDELNTANVVIADLTDNNPNVFYELGVRHTLANRTLLIAQGEEHIPFDLRPYPVAFYSESPAKIAEFKSDIKKKLDDIERNPERSDNPVADFLKARNIVLLSSEKEANLKKLAALISELSFNTRLVDIILDTIKENEEIRKKEPTKVGVTQARFDNACLELLLSTQYLIPLPELSVAVRITNSRLEETNSTLDTWKSPGFAEGVMGLLKNNLAQLKEKLIHLLQGINELRVNYINDNYVEPELTILVASPEHQKYIEATK